MTGQAGGWVGGWVGGRADRLENENSSFDNFYKILCLAACKFFSCFNAVFDV